MKHSYSKQDHLLNIVLVLFFILPQNMALYLFVPVAMIMLFQGKDRKDETLSFVIFVIFVCLAVALLLNIDVPWFKIKSVLKIIQFAVLLFCIGRYKSFVIIKEYLIFLLFYLALFQFAYQLNLPLIGNLMENIYPLPEEEIARFSAREIMTFSEIGSYTLRIGGIYYNANNCAFFLECLLLLFINERTQFKFSYFAIYIALLLVCIVATGSRTSFLVLILVALLNLRGQGAKASIAAAIFILAFVLLYNFVDGSFRIFQLNQGLSDSFSAKVAILSNYLNDQDSILRLAFGSLNGDCLPVISGSIFPGTDFDIGDIIVAYGIFGLFSILLLLNVLFSRLARKHKFFFCIFLWCFSNTVFMSYRGSSVVLLILGIYYMQSKEMQMASYNIK